MKRIILLFALFLAMPALADDAQNGLYWNSTKGLFQSLGRALGFKFIPDADYGTFSANFTGAATTSATWNWSKVGKSVTITWPRNASLTCSASFFTSSAIPSNLWPINQLFIPIFVDDNGVNQTIMGNLALSSLGIMTLGKTLASNNFTAAANCGYYEGSTSYQVP